MMLWADQLRVANPRRSLTLAPWLMLVWANTHGAFYFGLLFLTCCWMGSCLDKSAPAGGLNWRWLAACWGATLLTPYGWNYHLQQVTERLQSDANQLAVVASRHWEPIYTATNQALHLFEYWSGMLVIMILLVGRLWGQRPTWQLVAPNLAFAGLSLVHIRTNYLWAPLWFYTILILLKQYTWSGLSSKKWNALLVLLITFLAARTCWECYTRPYRGQFLGLGLGYLNPQREVEFIETHRQLGTRLYNSYEHGGYILWKLGPETQVMMDSRAFPYRICFGEYLAFAQGQNFSEFTAKYPADAALISWRDRECLRQFIRHPSWHCIFTGPVGAIFSRTRLDTESDPTRFMGIYSSDQLLQVFAGLMDLGDLRAAEELMAGAKGRMVLGRDQLVLQALSQHLQGLRQIESKDYAGALNTLEEAARAGFYVNHSLLDALRDWKRRQ
ncbi:hypothetical protein IV102_25635 [bacterium]|nr:hypothetical protein [bacterium]